MRIPQLTAIAACMLALSGCHSPKDNGTRDPQSPAKAISAASNTSNARLDAVNLLRSVIKPPAGPSGRLPEFLTWSTKVEMASCKLDRDRSSQQQHVRIDASVAMLTPANTATPPAIRDDLETGNFGANGFYYNDIAETRLCSNALGSIEDPKSQSRIMGGKLRKWWEDLADKPTEIDPFLPGSRAAAALWVVIPWPSGAGASNPIQEIWLHRRAPGSIPGSTSETLPIVIPETALNPSARPKCVAPLGEPTHPPVNPQGKLVSLDDFYWVQIGPGDTAMKGAQCGDFAVLVGFSLIEKKDSAASGKSGWLWSTFWWDRNPLEVFSTNKPEYGAIAIGAGAPNVWRNYAMDATYGTDNEIFNPWASREKPNSNCEFCHHNAAIPTENLPDPLGMGTPKPRPKDSLFFDFIYLGRKANLQ